MDDPPGGGSGNPSYFGAVRTIATVLVLLFVFLIGIQGLGSGFKLLGKDVLDTFFMATENPFVALVVGILATTLLQSSSVTTSMVVAMVAAPENPLPIANAVPMIMGANIGTTVTNTIVALGHMGRPAEFVRAFSVATCHDFFNFMTVAVLLPLTLWTGFLQNAAGWASSMLGGTGGVIYKSPLKGAVKSALGPIKSLAEAIFENNIGQAIVVIAASAVLIFVALYLLVTVLRSQMESRVQVYVTRALDSSAVVAMIVGAIITVAVQSSSITTALLVPLAGAGLITLRQAFPITLGANVGTTITALLASLAVSGPNAEAGIQIAFVHLLFNACGIALVYPIPFIRELPLRASTWLAKSAVKSKKLAIFYVAGLFYGLPGLLIYIHKLLTS